MEYTQWALAAFIIAIDIHSLNPCCNGIYSMRAIPMLAAGLAAVLILVVMEYTQWVLNRVDRVFCNEVLILVVMEYTQWAFHQKQNLF